MSFRTYWEQFSFGSGNGLVTNRQQTVHWTNDGLILRCIHTSHGLNIFGTIMTQSVIAWFAYPRISLFWKSVTFYIRRHSNLIKSINFIWVRSRNCGCLVTWICYQLIAKPGNKTATVPWPDPYHYGIVQYIWTFRWFFFCHNSMNVCFFFRYCCPGNYLLSRFHDYESVWAFQHRLQLSACYRQFRICIHHATRP